MPFSNSSTSVRAGQPPLPSPSHQKSFIFREGHPQGIRRHFGWASGGHPWASVVIRQYLEIIGTSLFETNLSLQLAAVYENLARKWVSHITNKNSEKP